MGFPTSPPEHLPAAPRQGCSGSCLGRALRLLGGILISSLSGWVTGLLTSAFVPSLVQSMGGETARQGAGLLSLMLAAVPFSISFLISLIGGLVFNRRRPRLRGAE